MTRLVYVSCSRCNEQFYVYGKDYIGTPDAPCHCPFCSNNFTYIEGRPRE